MKRKDFLHSSALAFGALTIGRQKILTDMFNNPWQMKKLRNNIGIFIEKGGTIAFMLSPKGVVVVDSQYPEQAKHLIPELKKATAGQFHLLLNTHHHGDHTSGNIAFKDLVPHVIAHENCLANHKRVAEIKKIVDEQLFADITFKDNWEGEAGDEKIKAYYFGPAHTNGDAIIHFQHANIIHMGDLVFNRTYPHLDRSAGTNMKNWVTVLHKAVSIFDNDSIFVFGHANNDDNLVGNKDDLKLARDNISKLLQFVESEIKAGKSLEDVKKAQSIPGVTGWDDNGGLSFVLEGAYVELTAK